MKIKLSNLTFAVLAVIATFSFVTPSVAQVAGGTTTFEALVTQSTELAAGWSVKKSLMGKTIYNDAGQKVGKVDDLIISPDKKVSYVIVGAGGFVGIGRHDVAIPVSEIQDQSGKLVMAGATQDLIKSMPPFTYATDTAKRDRFVAAADKDIAKGKAKVADLEKKAGTVATEAQAKMALEINAIRTDVKSAEAKLAEMKQASAARWREFEAGVSEATAKLRKSIDTAAG